jgi:hypothetical protein
MSHGDFTKKRLGPYYKQGEIRLPTLGKNALLEFMAGAHPKIGLATVLYTNEWTKAGLVRTRKNCVRGELADRRSPGRPRTPSRSTRNSVPGATVGRGVLLEA